MDTQSNNKQKDDPQNSALSFWGHLEVLRGHLVRSAISIFLFALLAFLNKTIIFDYIILAPKEAGFITNRLFCLLSEYLSIPALCINEIPLQLINIELAGQFKTHIVISLIAGIIIAFPYILWEFWRFLQPALTPKERANSRGAVFVTSFLFFLGVSFSYFLIVPLALNFLGTYQVSELVANHIALSSYINTVTMLTLATGLVFELPIIIYFLSRIGLVTPEIMRKNRKIALVLILVLSAIITPPDVVSQILVAIPLFFLYEISIGISKRAIKINNEG